MRNILPHSRRLAKIEAKVDAVFAIMRDCAGAAELDTSLIDFHLAVATARTARGNGTAACQARADAVIRLTEALKALDSQREALTTESAELAGLFLMVPGETSELLDATGLPDAGSDGR